MLAALLNQPITFGELPRPYGLFSDWAIWAANLTGAARDAQLPTPDEAGWEDWAREFIDAPGLRALALPGPAPGEDWEDWAGRVRLVYPGA